MSSGGSSGSSVSFFSSVSFPRLGPDASFPAFNRARSSVPPRAPIADAYVFAPTSPAPVDSSGFPTCAATSYHPAYLEALSVQSERRPAGADLNPLNAPPRLAGSESSLLTCTPTPRIWSAGTFRSASKRTASIASAAPSSTLSDTVLDRVRLSQTPWPMDPFM